MLIYCSSHYIDLYNILVGSNGIMLAILYAFCVWNPDSIVSRSDLCINSLFN